MTEGYAANLGGSTRPRDTRRARPADPAPGDPASEFEKLIKKAEEKQKELDAILKKVTKGVNGSSGCCRSPQASSAKATSRPASTSTG